MRLNGADRRLLAVVMAAGAAMVLCFALRSTALGSLSPLPWEPFSLTAAAQRDELVNINTAGMDELMSLPQIGEARARAILDDRAANGPYRYPEDLIRVKGIGEGVLSGILEQITTGGEGGAKDFSG